MFVLSGICHILKLDKSDLAGEENEMLDFCFTTFTHVTSFFGYRKRDMKLLILRVI